MNVGIIVPDDEVITAWEADMTARLAELPFIEGIYYYVFPALRKNKSNASFAYSIFSKLEQLWFKGKYDSKKKIRIRGIRFTIDSDNRDPLVVDGKNKISILESAPDVIFGTGLDLDTENISTLATYGLWSLNMGKNNDPAFTGFEEVMNDEPTIEAHLHVKFNGSMYRVYDGSTATVPYSVRNTFHSVAWNAASFLPARIKELHSTGTKAFFSNERLIRSKLTTTSPAPGNRTTSASAVRNVLRYLSWKKKIKQPSPSFTLLYKAEGYSDKTDFTSFTQLVAPAGMFWADPFVLEKEGTRYIFFEEYVAAKGRAHISMIVIDAAGNVSSPQIVLEKPYHLSYPFILEHEGAVYMIPETATARTVELYRAKDFPFTWEPVTTLMKDVVLLDATLLFHDDKWWMFGTTQNHPFTSTNDQLMLYYSDSLTSSEWTPHPQNPVVTRIEHCRPAGAFFRRDGKLFRPAQYNASRQYGFGMCIMEVYELTTTSYRENVVHSHLPSTPLKALHTLNFTSSFTVIDGIVGGG